MLLTNKVYSKIAIGDDQIDPLLIWYSDVFLIHRERYLVFTNPKTKFSFFIFRYNKKTFPDFLKAFREKLTYTMQEAEMDPAKIPETMRLAPSLSQN